MCFVAAVESRCARMWLWDFLQEFGVPMLYDPPYISFKCIDMCLLILMYVIWSMHVSADRTSSSQTCVLISQVLIEKQPLDLVVTSVRTRYHIRHLEKPVENNSLAGFEGLVAKDSSWWCDGRTWCLEGVSNETSWRLPGGHDFSMSFPGLMRRSLRWFRDLREVERLVERLVEWCLSCLSCLSWSATKLLLPSRTWELWKAVDLSWNYWLFCWLFWESPWKYPERLAKISGAVLEFVSLLPGRTEAVVNSQSFSWERTELPGGLPGCWLQFLVLQARGGQQMACAGVLAKWFECPDSTRKYTYNRIQ